ncbi:MAG TPA: sigma-54-dependent Fis family transcriptional regulator, partial [Myxococcales bacterium]|nr:sigma-54-dependent Fis family transcriptional regulator [Myxococcales bacterium]
DVRVVAATNRNLGAMVREGRFREDLYYRIRVVPILLPGLRERRQDIPLLVDHFVGRFAVKTGKPIRQVAPAAFEALCGYDYPGNVRELENIIERAFVLCHGPRIELSHLPDEVVWGRSQLGEQGAVAERPPVMRLPDTPEARRILEVLEAHRWNRTDAAKALGIGRNTLWRRMKKLGLLE